MLCDEPIRRGPNKGQPARGTTAGYQRHWKAGEPACGPCLEAMARRTQAKLDKRRAEGWVSGYAPKVLKTCEWCGREWNTYNNDRIRFCSRKCADAVRSRARVPDRECRWCGSAYRPKVGQKQHCSDLCRVATQTFNRRTTPWAEPWADRDGAVAGILRCYADRFREAEATAARRCGMCDAPIAHRHSNALWCGEKCRRYGMGYVPLHAPIFVRECDVCDNLFIGRNAEAKYCSRGCRKSVGRQVSPALRQRVHERDGFTCQICGGQTDPNDFTVVAGIDGREAIIAGSLYPSVDHIVPQSVGGSHKMVNLRTAHRDCNSLRGVAEGEQLAWAV